MCVIATKAVGALLPDEDTLRRCFTSNPDGAGFAFSTKDKVFWKKGFLTFDSFYKELKKVFPTAETEKEFACIMHFRIGTHGPKKSPTHTHPFPADVDSIQKTCELEGSSEMVLFHNGIIYDMTKVPHDKVTVDGKEEEPSDSQILTQEFVNPMLKAYKKRAFTVAQFDNFMFSLISTSKIALLMPNGKIVRYGTWAKDDPEFAGCHFSNLSYEKPLPVTRSYGSAWDDERFDEYIDNYPYKGSSYGKSPYWTAYDAYFKKYPNSTMKAFQAYWAEVQKQASKKGKHKKVATENNGQKCLPFWEVHTKHGFASNSSFYLKLHAKAKIWVSDSSFIEYDPDIDGEIYYWTSMTTPTNGMVRECLYVKENDGKFYYLGTYSFSIEKEGEPINAQTDIKLLESPTD